jgi:hypothetical protein
MLYSTIINTWGFLLVLWQVRTHCLAPKQTFSFLLVLWQVRTHCFGVIMIDAHRYKDVFTYGSCTSLTYGSCASIIIHWLEKRRKENRIDTMKNFCYKTSFLLLITLNSTTVYSEVQQCRPSGRISGKETPSRQCNQENDSDCRVQGQMYTTFNVRHQYQLKLRHISHLIVFKKVVTEVVLLIVITNTILIIL